MQSSYDEGLTREKAEQKSLFDTQAVNVCKWYHQQDWKPRSLEPSGQQEHLRRLARLSLEQGLGREQLWVLLHELQRPRDEKKSQLSQDRAREDQKNILFTIWKILLIEIQNQATNRAT